MLALSQFEDTLQTILSPDGESRVQVAFVQGGKGDVNIDFGQVWGDPSAFGWDPGRGSYVIVNNAQLGLYAPGFDPELIAVASGRIAGHEIGHFMLDSLAGNHGWDGIMRAGDITKSFLFKKSGNFLELLVSKTEYGISKVR